MKKAIIKLKKSKDNKKEEICEFIFTYIIYINGKLN